MDPEIIDLIYQNDEVVGVAVFSKTGDLIENQLSINDESISVVAQTISSIASALHNAERELKGFLLQSTAVTLQVCVVSDFILVMQMAEEFSANKVEQSVRSIFTGIVPTDPTPSPVPAVSEEVVNAAASEPVESQPAGNQIDVADFKSQMRHLLKRVAPGPIAEKMITDTFTAEGIDTSATSIPKEQAIELGAKVVEKIPNKSRRKMIENEYALLIKQLS